MQYRKAGQTDLNLSILGLGTMTMGWSSDKETSFAVMDSALEGGINFFDTADIYSNWVPGNPGGVSESYIGQWMAARKNRSKIILATKVRGRMWDGPTGEGLSRVHIMRAVEDSLRRLQTDYIDLYQTHWPDEDVPVEETLRALDELVQQGKVRYIGCSNHNAQQLKTALETSQKQGLVRYETLQPHYNLVHRAEFESELLSLCQNKQIGVIPYSPLAGGFLTGKYRRNEDAPANSRGAGNNRMEKYSTPTGFAIIDKLTDLAKTYQTTPAQIALAWMLAKPVITSAIVGARTPQQLNQTLKTINITLSREDLLALDSVSDW